MSITTRIRSLWPQRKAPKARRPEAAPRPVNPVAVSERRIEKPTLGLPRFHTTAADHVDRERADPRARERVRLRASFTPAQPVIDPRMFAGRRDILETLIRAVEDQRSHVVIYGERGAGKTSLLRMLSRAERAAQVFALEEKAAKLAPKMVLPMMLFVLPTVGLISAGPAVIRLLAVFK